MGFKKVTRAEVKEVEVDIGESLYCDNCGQLIYSVDKTKPNSGQLHDASYFHIVTGHNDWGNDSVDSIETSYACSTDCMQKYIDKYKEHCKTSDTCYIEIEQCREVIREEQLVYINNN